jgi:hypothetical protein
VTQIVLNVVRKRSLYNYLGLLFLLLLFLRLLDVRYRFTVFFNRLLIGWNILLRKLLILDWLGLIGVLPTQYLCCSGLVLLHFRHSLVYLVIDYHAFELSLLSHFLHLLQILVGLLPHIVPVLFGIAFFIFLLRSLSLFLRCIHTIDFIFSRR